MKVVVWFMCDYSNFLQSHTVMKKWYSDTCIQKILTCKCTDPAGECPLFEQKTLFRFSGGCKHAANKTC